MSKSIYEEALQELKDVTTDLKDLEIIHSYDVSKIEKALKQAQKQEKLLELYRELMSVKDMIIFLSFNRSYDDDTEEIERDLEKQIKELEKLIIKEDNNDL